MANNGTFGVDQLLLYWVAQFLGAMIGATIVFLHYYPHWKETENPDLKLAVFSTGPAIRNTAGTSGLEIVGTFVAGLRRLQPGRRAPRRRIGGALSWGLLVLVIGLSLGGTTGYAINPARDLGPRIMHAILPIPGKGD